MSDCGNCSCADKSQCVKKGSSYVLDVVETADFSYGSAVVTEAYPVAEQEGDCKCGPSCSCNPCNCPR